MFNKKKNCDMIITEKEKSKVVFSSLLQRHYPKLDAELVDIIFSYHKGLGAVFHTKDYWVRDFMPIQIDGYVFVKFVYNPDYLQDKKKYITNVDKVIKTAHLHKITKLWIFRSSLTEVIWYSVKERIKAKKRNT